MDKDMVTTKGRGRKAAPTEASSSREEKKATPRKKSPSQNERGAQGSSGARHQVVRRGRPKKTAGHDGELKFIPLGGLGEIGKNMYALQYGNDMVLIDCGLMFPDEDMLGIDFVIPDTTYLEEHRDQLRGIVLTHGHEDHIGALPFVLPRFNVPLYGTRLTLGLVSHKLSEATPRFTPQLMEVQAGESIKLGCFTLRFISVCHSIPDAVAIAIETPVGTVIHTGDFKFDPTPVDGRGTDYATFAELGREGVLLLTSDSTNVERAGFTPSEKTLVPAIDRLMRTYRKQRIVISSFASNLHRVQLVLDAAARFERKVVFAGRSMVNNVELAMRLGYLTATSGMIVPLQEIDQHPAHKLIVMTTGSQGEPFSGLVLMSKGQHHKVRLGEDDVVALFANPIPGNERTVSNTINRLFELKCEVLYEKEQQLHVSGHASREELKMLLNLVRPKYFAPVHGEYRMLVRHGQLAVESGTAEENVFLLHNGDVLSMNRHGASIKERVTAGAVLVDGLALGEKESSLVKERQDLAENGVLVVSLLLDSKGALAADPQFQSYGQIHLDDAENIRRDFTDTVRRVVKRSVAGDIEGMKRQIVMRCRELLKKYIRSTSCVLPLITRLGDGKSTRERDVEAS